MPLDGIGIDDDNLAAGEQSKCLGYLITDCPGADDYEFQLADASSRKAGLLRSRVINGWLDKSRHVREYYVTTMGLVPLIL